MSRMRMLMAGAMMAGLAAATYNGPPLPAATLSAPSWKRRTKGTGPTDEGMYRAQVKAAKKAISKANKRGRKT